MAKKPKSKFPAGAASDYYASVKKLLKLSHANVVELFDSKIAALSNQRNDADELIQISVMLDEVREETLDYFFTEAQMVLVADNFARAVKHFKQNEFARQYKAVASLDPLLNNDKLTGIVEAALKENISYIKSIPQQYHDKVDTVILQGVRRGKSNKEIAQSLQEVYDVSLKKAKFIARDQAGSLSLDLTKAQHETVGLKTYIWSTAGDGKVRSTHDSFNGKVFTWQEGAGGLHPGEDYGCRCVAELNENELMRL